ncbi:MAG TPA: acyl transferase, partial [Cyclobacteriaceae bacterium]|nr:acyl transferase [Cyclobacteriaceae bacterium]
RISNYLQNTQACFEAIYGPIQHYNLFALLPAYLERKDSSLVLMMDHFIKQSQTPFPGFYLYNTADLLRDIDKARQSDKQILLLGVSFALLDLAENTQPDLSDCIIMETGGMKGRRKEITRQELHTVLKQAFRVEVIHAEYGMTELLSQAYAKHNGLFQCPNTMKVFIRDVNDPFSYLPAGRTGGINIIDLANADSCAFIETEDLGKWHEEGYFEVLGRFDQSDVRGCNLLFN